MGARGSYSREQNGEPAAAAGWFGTGIIDRERLNVPLGRKIGPTTGGGCIPPSHLACLPTSERCTSSNLPVPRSHHRAVGLLPRFYAGGSEELSSSA